MKSMIKKLLCALCVLCGFSGCSHDPQAGAFLDRYTVEVVDGRIEVRPILGPFPEDHRPNRGPITGRPTP